MLTFRWQRDGEDILIAVADDGLGMSEEAAAALLAGAMEPRSATDARAGRGAGMAAAQRGRARRAVLWRWVWGGDRLQAGRGHVCYAGVSLVRGAPSGPRCRRGRAVSLKGGKPVRGIGERERSMRAMIVDDEAPARSELRYLLEETGRVDAIMEATSAREAVEKLMEAKADRHVPRHPDAQDLGHAARQGPPQRQEPPPAVVFVTAYSEYAVEAFQVDAPRLPHEAGGARASQPGPRQGAVPHEASDPEPLPPWSASPWSRAGARSSSPSTRSATSRAKGRLLLHLHRRRPLPLHDLARQARAEARAPRLLPRAPRLHREPRVRRGVEVISSGILQLGVNRHRGQKISVSRRRGVALKEGARPLGCPSEGLFVTIKRYDIVSDSHGYLSPELLDALQGADVIVHAGDICSPRPIARSARRARACRCASGTTTGPYDYGPGTKDAQDLSTRAICAGRSPTIRQRLNLQMSDIAICGHTHTPSSSGTNGRVRSS